MTDMIERAAEAIWTAQGWATNSPWEKRRDVMKDETRAEARAALLAALDPEDEALVEHVAKEMACGPLKHPILWPRMTEERRIDWRIKAMHAIAALKASCSQGEK